MVLEVNTKDFPTAGVKRAPTLHNFIPEGNYLIGSGSNVNMSVIESPVIKIRGHLTINSMVLRQIISIEVDQEGDE